MSADLDYRYAVFRLGLLVLGLALFVWGVRARRRGSDPQRSLRLGCLAFVAATAWGSYYSFFWHARLHVQDTFHYYVGAKYFSELGYYGLYDCALQALVEAGRADARGLPHVRDLRSTRLEPPQAALERGPRCKEAFSTERWREFSSDVRWFRARTTDSKWQHVMEDHGYHPSPVWTLFGRPLASAFPLSDSGTRVLARLDLGLVLGALVFMGFTVGWEAACLAAIVWGTGFLWRYGWIGDAFLRHLWLATSLAGLCLLRLGRPGSGAVPLVTAGLLRIFPAVFWIGWAAHALREALRTRTMPPPARRFAGASLLAAAVLVSASVLVSGRGPAVYAEFAQKISRFADLPAANKLGLGVVTQALEQTLAALGGAGEDGPAPASPGLRGAIRGLRFLVVGLGLLAFWRALAHAEPWEAAALGMTLVPILSNPTNYYYSFVLAALFLAFRRPRIGVLLFLACIAWSANGLAFYGRDAEFVGASFVALALSFAILREMARPPEQVRRARRSRAARGDRGYAGSARVR